VDVLRRLGQACRHARSKGGVLLLDISMRAGISQGQLSKFERGLATPERLVAVVEAYEAECGLPDGELWRRAIRE
jgi:transcriptional regulator with XRE-family HTH domain